MLPGWATAAEGTHTNTDVADSSRRGPIADPGRRTSTSINLGPRLICKWPSAAAGYSTSMSEPIGGLGAPQQKVL